MGVQEMVIHALKRWTNYSSNNWKCLRILLQFLYIIKDLMSDLAEFMQILKNWQSQAHTKTVTDVLMRIQKCKNTEDQSELNQLLQILVTFHKQINKAAKDKVQQKWFTEVMKSKNNLKKIIQQLKKKQIKVPKLIKSNSQIQYPQQQIKDKDQLYKTVMRALYKHYLFNMDEEIMKQKPKICQFFDKVIHFMFQEFQFKGQKNKNQNSTIRLMERVDKISKQLGKSDCSMAKKQMLQGMIKPDLVAKCDPLGFFSQQAERIKQQRLDAIAKQSQTGFYDQLKKKINIDANQECRFCHKPTAYCQGQKQIRASDEPMTRFMICNTCGKRWRQE